MDKNVNIVSLDEMIQIYLNNPIYAERYERIKNAPSIIPSASGMKIPYLLAWHARGRSLLYLHIVAEQMFREDRDAFNWEDMTGFEPHGYVPLVELLMNPLVWTDGMQYMQDMVLEGRVAKEQYMPERGDEVVELLHFLEDKGLLHYANNPDIVDEDDPDEGYLKGMHFWLPLTSDYEGLIADALNGKHVTYEDIRQAKAYDATCLRRRLGFIADELGGAKAAELLRMLQKEWKSIKLWKTELHSMTEEEIGQFEQMLLNGFDDILEQWDAEAPKVEEPKQAKKKPVQQDRTYITFTMSGITVGHIDMLRQKLIQVGWIAKDTLPDNFYKLFSGKTNSIKITWTGAVGKGMLLFLFQKMVDQGEIVVPDNHSITTILESHFVDEHGIYISGLNSSKESPKHFPIVKECLNILQLEVDND